MLMPCRSRVVKYSATRPAGTGVPPSPPIAVVTPSRSLFSASPLRGSTPPDWSIMSIQPGLTYLPRGVDLRAAARGDLADLREAAVLDRDVGEDQRIPLPVEHAAVADDDVVERVARRRRRGRLRRAARDARRRRCDRGCRRTGRCARRSAARGRAGECKPRAPRASRHRRTRANVIPEMRTPDTPPAPSGVNVSATCSRGFAACVRNESMSQ